MRNSAERLLVFYCILEARDIHIYDRKGMRSDVFNKYYYNFLLIDTKLCWAFFLSLSYSCLLCAIALECLLSVFHMKCWRHQEILILHKRYFLAQSDKLMTMYIRLDVEKKNNMKTESFVRDCVLSFSHVIYGGCGEMRDRSSNIFIICATCRNSLAAPYQSHRQHAAAMFCVR